jgi:hypothetical protein
VQGWKPALDKNGSPYPKITKAKRADSMSQVVEHLPSSARPRLQIPTLLKRKKKKKKKKENIFWLSFVQVFFYPFLSLHPLFLEL